MFPLIWIDHSWGLIKRRCPCKSVTCIFCVYVSLNSRSKSYRGRRTINRRYRSSIKFEVQTRLRYHRYRSILLFILIRRRDRLFKVQSRRGVAGGASSSVPGSKRVRSREDAILVDKRNRKSYCDTPLEIRFVRWCKGGERLREKEREMREWKG